MTRTAVLVLAAIARLGRRVGAPSAPADLERRIAAAGLPVWIGSADVMALKGGAAVAAGTVALLPALALPGRLWIAALVAAPAGGFLAPDAWLRRRAAARAHAIALDLPAALDLVRVAFAAGLPAARGLGEAGRRGRGPFAAELRAAQRRIELGMPQCQALALLAARCPCEAVAGFVAALDRAERHGASVAPALTALAAQARADRAQAVHERAAKAAPKIQLAVALLLVPAALLLVAAAMLATLVP